MLTVDMLEPGDLVITEMMVDPTCPSDACEWIEVYNARQLPVDLMGLGVGVGVGGLMGSIATNLPVGPGEYAVLTRSASAWPYTAADYDAEYGNGVSLPNDPEAYVVRIGTTTVEFDRTAELSGSFTLEGQSVSLDPGALDWVSNNEETAWCAGTDVLIQDSEFGSPGEANPMCPTS